MSGTDKLLVHGIGHGSELSTLSQITNQCQHREGDGTFFAFQWILVWELCHLRGPWLQREVSRGSRGGEEGRRYFRCHQNTGSPRRVVLFETISWHLAMNIASGGLGKYVLDKWMSVSVNELPNGWKALAVRMCGNYAVHLQGALQGAGVGWERMVQRAIETSTRFSIHWPSMMYWMPWVTAVNVLYPPAAESWENTGYVGAFSGDIFLNS